mmetsp:Transcript_24225/g.21515  ORF Transcript_24225/g.21515 Transcript_24225/m.21515 type:complete len:109 (+) Transcript_24225:1-327(+)
MSPKSKKYATDIHKIESSSKSSSNRKINEAEELMKNLIGPTTFKIKTLDYENDTLVDINKLLPLNLNSVCKKRKIPDAMLEDQFLNQFFKVINLARSDPIFFANNILE